MIRWAKVGLAFVGGMLGLFASSFALILLAMRRQDRAETEALWAEYAQRTKVPSVPYPLRHNVVA